MTPPRRTTPMTTAGRRFMEQGRQLASERDDLIAAGVDPAELAVPIAPYDPNIIGPITIPATAKLQPGDLVRITGPGSWEIEEPPAPTLENDAIDAAYFGQVIHDVLTAHPELALIPDPDDPWKLTRIYKCKGCGDLIDIASAPKQFGSVQWCLNAHQARKIVEALSEL